MTWHHRFASHLGYRPPFEPLFAATVGSHDPVEHIRFAADQGFAGMLYAAARSRPVEEQARVGQALADAGLQAGCILYTGFDQLRNTRWGRLDDEARDWIDHEITQAIEVAARVGSRHIVVLAGADLQRPLALQRAAMAEHLRRAADLAARAGCVLCLETLSRRSVPDMLLQHLPDAYAVVQAARHPAVRLIFDTSHVQIMDGDLLAHLDQCWDAIEVVQLADNPGRTEPGTGEINFESVLRALRQRGYGGLVELEWGWRVPGLASEQRGLARLRALDAASALDLASS